MIAVYVIFIAVGALGLGVGLLDLFRARNSRHWPVRQGRVLEAAVRKRRAPIGGGVGPTVRYEYRHDGVVYEGTRLMFSGGLALESSRADVERFLADFEKGGEITVHVSPRNPRISVVKPGVDRRLVVMIVVASYLIFMGVGGVFGWWK